MTISARSFAASSGRLPFSYCSIESCRCFTALRMTMRASSSDSSCPASICWYFSADCSMRRVESFSAFFAFMASVNSARICSVSFTVFDLLGKHALHAETLAHYSPTPMSLDLGALLQQTGALLSGHFCLSSGLHSATTVHCARLLGHPPHP